MTTLSVHCTVRGITRPSIIDRRPKSGTKPYRLAPREVIEILCMCVRHEHFAKTSKIRAVNFGLSDKQLIIHSTQSKHLKLFLIHNNQYNSTKK